MGLFKKDFMTPDDKEAIAGKTPHINEGKDREQLPVLHDLDYDRQEEFDEGFRAENGEYLTSADLISGDEDTLIDELDRRMAQSKKDKQLAKEREGV